MKKLILMMCLLTVTLAAHAQFEKGKWILNPSVSGIGLNYDSQGSSTSFGLQANGGFFLIDNFAVMAHVGATWQPGADNYNVGVGGRYYFNQTGIYAGAGVNADHNSDTRFALALEAGYAFFLSKTVTLEPAVYWNVGDGSRLGVKLGFGFYF
jgi:hypothetical protein